MASDTRTLKVVVTGDSTGAARALRDVGDEAEKTQSRLSRVGSFIGTWAVRGAAAFGAAGAAGVALGISTASGLEQARIAFTNMLGDATKADKFLRQMQDFAAKTPFEFPELVKSAQMMMAMGINAKDVLPTLTAVGDAVAGMGGGSEQVELIVRALGQMQAKGRVAGEEILQMTEQGIPALKILADGYGVSTGQLQKMMEKGQILADKAIPILVKGLEQGTKSTKGFGGMMQQQSQTIQGKWSNMTDTLKMGLADLVSNAFPLLNTGMQAVTDAAGAFFGALKTGKSQGGDGFVRFASDAALKIREFAEWLRTDGVEWVKRFWAAIQTGLQTGQELLTWASEHKTLLMVLVGAYAALIAIEKAHVAIMTVQRVLSAIHNGQLGVMLMKITAVRGAVALWTAAQWLLNIALNANPIGLVVAAIAILVAGFVLLWNKSETFRNAVKALWAGFQTAWENMGKIFKFFEYGIIRPGIAAIVGMFLNMVGVLIDGAANAFGWIPGIGPKLKDVQKKFHQFKTDVNNAIRGINDRTVNVDAKYGSDFKALVKAGVVASSKSSKARAIVLGYNTGGPVIGGGSSTGDKIPALLSAGEHVWTGREVAAAGGHGGVERLRKAVLLGLAKGGPVDFNIRSRQSGVDLGQTAAINRYLSAGMTTVARTAATLSLQTFAGAGGGPYVSPVGRRPAFPWGRYPSGGIHRAYDYPVPVGTPVRAPYGATVIRAGWDTTGFGNHIRTHDVDGAYSIFGHLSKILVRVGQLVARGAIIALSGNSGNSTGPHLHWERRTSPYNPASAFNPDTRARRYDSGGVLWPGWTSAYNGTGRPERVGKFDWPEPVINVNVTVEGSVVTERNLVKAITLEVRDELLRHAHRNGGRTGLPGK